MTIKLSTELIYAINPHGTKFKIMSIDEERKDVYLQLMDGNSDELMKFPIYYITDKIKNGSISGLQPMKCRIK